MLLRWTAPGPYEVAFSTREGGVSEGPFASLNLALRAGDEPDAVQENRRRLCAEVGANLDALSLNRQTHTTLVHRAHRGKKGEPGDGLWTDEPGLPILAMGADCLTIARGLHGPEPWPYALPRLKDKRPLADAADAADHDRSQDEPDRRAGEDEAKTELVPARDA